MSTAMMAIEVIKPGALSTFQDLGRHGFQQLGVPANGVMDEQAHRLANALVGNPQGDATLEITLMGPSLRFPVDTAVAVCGADLEAAIDGIPLPVGQPGVVPAGGTLSFGKRRNGLRAYLAVAGGFAIEPVMQSRSTFVRGGYGGAQGKPLRKGELISLRAPRATVPAVPVNVTALAQTASSASDTPMRVVRGREWDAFTQTAQSDFTELEYKIGAQSDRMGYRLEGPALALHSKLEMLSEAVAFGTIQVPPDGQPIVLMADRQTTGGYPKIGHVCAVDLPRLAQHMPGERIRFQVISIEEAQRLSLLQEQVFAALESCHG
nr:biotin-dependent carboxyltransferase family protein [uncultured Cupriavidus sp.]